MNMFMVLLDIIGTIIVLVVLGAFVGKFALGFGIMVAIFGLLVILIKHMEKKEKERGVVHLKDIGKKL